MILVNISGFAMSLTFHVIGRPACFLVGAFLLDQAADNFDKSAFLQTLAPHISTGSTLFAIAAAAVLAFNVYRVWRARTGADDDACYECAMPTTHKNGRYGPYFKCWNCGANRPDR
jgi:membrane-bound ClpP family serine protease